MSSNFTPAREAAAAPSPAAATAHARLTRRQLQRHAVPRGGKRRPLPSPPPRRACIAKRPVHTHMHMHMHTHAPAHTHMHDTMPMLLQRPCTCRCTCPCTYTCACTCTCICPYTRITRVCPHAHSAGAYTCTFTCACTSTYTRTCMPPSICMHTQMHTHTHIHTQTHLPGAHDAPAPLLHCSAASGQRGIVRPCAARKHTNWSDYASAHAAAICTGWGSAPDGQFSHLLILPSCHRYSQ